MEEKCVYCNETIPAGACQQGQMFDGTWFPLHVNCADIWGNEEIEVWTICGETYRYTADKDAVLSEIENIEEDQTLTFKKWKMPRLKYYTLPEMD